MRESPRPSWRAWSNPGAGARENGRRVLLSVLFPLADRRSCLFCLDRAPHAARFLETVPLRNARRLAARLDQQRAEAYPYRRLAILNRDAAIEGVTPTLDDLEWHGVPRDEFLALCAELGFDRIRERIHLWAA